MTYSHIPAEWQPQDATLLVWPTPQSDWTNTLSIIERGYATLTKVIAHKQYVILVCFDETHQQHVTTVCQQHDCNMLHIKLITIETNDTWVRDYGPQFLKHENGEIDYLNLSFNAWGEQYAYQHDQAFTNKLYHTFTFNTINHFKSVFIFEGGNLDVDDNGNVLTNLNCTVRNNSRSTHTIKEVQQKTKDLLHARHVIGLQLKPLQGDDTGGHIDTLARFINNQTIAYAASNGPADPNYACLQELQQQLHDYNKKIITPYQLIPIKMPLNPAYDDEENILPNSYLNFLFINDAVLIPLYNDPNDSLTLEQFKILCPDREIIGIDATAFIEQFGSLHCASLHIPQKALHESWLNSAK